MDVAVLFSGGKDSTFAVYDSLRRGHRIKYLITIIPENPESYMFHYPNIALAELQARLMRIPIITRFTKGEKEKELGDLKKALSLVKREIDGVVAGGLKSKYQIDRIGKLCHGLRLKSIAPLWNIDPERYWNMILKARFEVMVTSVSAEGLGKPWLGKKIDREALELLKELSAKYKFHLGFEGGEAETLVLDCPLFRKKIKITEAETKWSEDSGMYIIKKVKLVSKNK